MIIEKIIVCFFAGLAAGVGTGFAGMSAAAVIAPMLSCFLGIPIYEAIGIGLISDVLASLVSAYNYKRSGNLDIKNSLVMLITVLVLTILGSLIGSFVKEDVMNSTVQIAMIIIGLRFIIKPINNKVESINIVSQKQKIIKSLIGGIIIGFICGFIGAGGGMMMLFVLTSFLGYPLHMAVGTSVFIMAFTALTGGISHFVIGGIPDLLSLILSVTFTFVFAQMASRIANKSEPKLLNRIVGVVLISTSIVILVVNNLLK